MSEEAAPQLELRKCVEETRGYAFILQDMDILEKQYGGKYVAFRDGEVAGAYDNTHEVPDAMMQCVRDKSAILFFVSKPPEPDALMFHSFGLAEK